MDYEKPNPASSAGRRRIASRLQAFLGFSDSLRSGHSFSNDEKDTGEAVHYELYSTKKEDLCDVKERSTRRPLGGRMERKKGWRVPRVKYSQHTAGSDLRSN